MSTEYLLSWFIEFKVTPLVLKRTVKKKHFFFKSIKTLAGLEDASPHTHYQLCLLSSIANTSGYSVSIWCVFKLCLIILMLNYKLYLHSITINLKLDSGRWWYTLPGWIRRYIAIRWDQGMDVGGPGESCSVGADPFINLVQDIQIRRLPRETFSRKIGPNKKK